jgi:hypothetical protein
VSFLVHGPFFIGEYGDGIAPNGCGDATYDKLSAYKKVTMHSYIDYPHGCEGVRTTRDRRELKVNQIESSVLTIRHDPRRMNVSVFVVFATLLIYFLQMLSTLSSCPDSFPFRECFGHNDDIPILLSLIFLSLLTLTFKPSSQVCTIDKKQNTVTCKWKGYLDTKLGAKTVEWSLSDIIAVEMQIATKHEYFRVCLASGYGTRMPVCACTLDHVEATYLSERIHQFLNLRSPIRTQRFNYSVEPSRDRRY